jgi:hypothetical protein
MAGRSRIDDDEIVRTDPADANDFEHREQLVDPWDRQFEQRVYVSAIEPGAVFERIAESQTMVAEPTLEDPWGVELQRVERAARSDGNADAS